jgi:hypothetical protein
MIGRSAALWAAACIVGLSIAGQAQAGRFAGRGGAHFAGSPGFHGGFHGGGFHHFHSRVFIGGTFFAPFYFPPPYYYYPPEYSPPAYYPPAAEYVEPQPSPAPAYWYYCAGSRAYYPYVRECPGGWQRVAPQPPQ